MSKERFTKITTPKIVQGREGLPGWVWLLGLIGLGLWTWQTYEFGTKSSAFPLRVVSSSDTSDLQQRLADLENERNQLRFEVARFERGGQIDRHSVENVNGQLTALRQERDSLQKEVARLRSLLAEGDSNFSISDYALSSTSGSQDFGYTFTISRKVEGAKRVEGLAIVSIRGQSNGELVELSMDKISADGEARHKLGFKQFQVVEGRIRLPQGFQPLELIIDIRISEPSPKGMIVSFDWI